MVDGSPEEVARQVAQEWFGAIQVLKEHFPAVEAMVRNARMSQIQEALDPRAIGISPSPELFGAWEASADASICARTIGVLDLLAKLADALYSGPER